MSRYNIFQAIYMSFYSKDLYQDVGQNWGGKAFFYLLVLLSLSWIGQTAIFQTNINHLYDQGAEKLIAQVPVITIKDGKVSTPENRPYILKDPDGDGVIAVIDTSGKYTELDQDNGALLVTKTQIISKPKANETRIYQIPEKTNMTIDPSVVSSYIQKYISFAWVLMFPILVILSFVYRIIQAIFYAVIGKIFSLISSSDVRYGRILQITLIALTPAIVLSTIFSLIGVVFQHQNAAYFFISMLYMFYGIIANRKSS